MASTARCVSENEGRSEPAVANRIEPGSFTPEGERQLGDSFRRPALLRAVPCGADGLEQLVRLESEGFRDERCTPGSDRDQALVVPARWVRMWLTDPYNSAERGVRFLPMWFLWPIAAMSRKTARLRRAGSVRGLARIGTGFGANEFPRD
jgi:hypothetical protein